MNFIYEMQLFLLNLRNNMFMASSERIMLFDSWIRQSENIVIVAHLHPDGDAVGSVTAMGSFLRECRRRNAHIILPDRAPAALSFLCDKQDIIDGTDRAAKILISGADLIIALDFNSFKRTDTLEGEFRTAHGRKVLIDHHPEPATGEFDLIFSRTNVSSASELLFTILTGMPGIDGDASKLPSDCARSLMTGMTTDTNNFANSVFPSTLDMASRLIAAGVDRDGIIERIYNSGREEKLRAWSHLLDKELRIMDCGVAYMVLRQETKDAFGLQDGETDGLVNIPLQIGKVRVSALLTEEDGHFRISLRSKKELAINTLARDCFHGGGHPQASGGRILIPDDIPDRNAVNGYFESVAARFMQTIQI